MDFTTLNHTRRSIRDYDPGFKIDRITLERLLNEAALAPSAYNMQGYKVIAVLSPEEKQKLHGVAMKQPQVLDASAMLIILGNLHAYKGLRHILEQSPGMPPHLVDAQPRDAEKNHGENLQKQRDEALRTASLFAMNFMLAAGNEGWSTGPMIGFDVDGVCREFGIEHPYFPMMLISIGKATKVLGARGFRKPAFEFTEFR